MGIGFLGLGFQPKWRQEDIPQVPKVIIALYYQIFEIILLFLVS
jgi:gamma-glutamylcysteine synthetase